MEQRQQEVKKTIGMLENLVIQTKKIQVNLRKFDNGNGAAGIRARKSLQKLLITIKTIRTEVQKIKKIRRIEKAERIKQWIKDNPIND